MHLLFVECILSTTAGGRDWLCRQTAWSHVPSIPIHVACMQQTNAQELYIDTLQFVDKALAQVSQTLIALRINQIILCICTAATCLRCMYEISYVVPLYCCLGDGTFLRYQLLIPYCCLCFYHHLTSMRCLGDLVDHHY